MKRSSAMAGTGGTPVLALLSAGAIALVISLGGSCRTPTDPNSQDSTKTGADTTTHEFHWALDTLGTDYSYLSDISVVDANDIWSAGEINGRDSNQNRLIFNIAHWQGQRWNAMQIYKLDPRLGQGASFSVLAVTHSDIWLGSNHPSHWNGSAWEQILRQDGLWPGGRQGVYRIRRAESGEVLFLCDSGVVLRRDPSGVFVREETGTRAPFVDATQLGGDILGTAGNMETGPFALLRRTGSGWHTWMSGYRQGAGYVANELFKTQLLGGLSAVWADTSGRVLVGGDYLYKYSNGAWSFDSLFPNNDSTSSPVFRGYILAISGPAWNDVFVAGQGGTLEHFNGRTWKQIAMQYSWSNPITFLAASYRNGVWAFSGTDRMHGILLRVWR